MVTCYGVFGRLEVLPSTDSRTTITAINGSYFVLFVVNEPSIARWVEALRSPRWSGTFTVRCGLAVAEITRVENNYHISTYNINSSAIQVIVVFNEKQARLTAIALEKIHAT